MTEASPRPGGTGEPTGDDRTTQERTGDQRIDEGLDRLRAADPADLDAQIALGSQVHDARRDRLSEQA